MGRLIKFHMRVLHTKFRDKYTTKIVCEFTDATLIICNDVKHVLYHDIGKSWLHVYITQKYNIFKSTVK